MPSRSAAELLAGTAAVIMAGYAVERLLLRRYPPDVRRWLRRCRQKELVALHESGHAAIALSCGFVVESATIKPDPAARIGSGYLLGETRVRLDDSEPAPLCWSSPTLGNIGDLQSDASKLRIFFQHVRRSGRRALLRGIADETQQLVVAHWPTIVRLSKALQQRTTLGREEILEVVR